MRKAGGAGDSRRAGARLLVLVLVASLGVVGCSRELEAPVVAQDQTEAEVVTLRGELVWGHETRSFIECGATEASWVVDESEGTVREIYERLASSPYQKLFFEVRGRREGPVEAGFAADYSGSVVIIQVRRAEYEGHGCDDDLTDIQFRAAGVEPFWSLEISSSELSLSRPDLPESMMWGHRGSALESSAVVFREESQVHGSIEVELTASRCVDAMSGAHFPLTAAVRLGGETFRGCALEGDLAQR